MKRYDSYKDSGVEWIGDVPSHWEIVRMKYTCDFNGRIGFRGYSQADLVSEGEGAITLSPTNMNDIFVDYNKCSYLSWEKYYESPEIMVKQGDVLLVKTASVGKCSYVKTIPMECTVNPQILVLKKHRQNPMFLTYLFQIPIGQTYIDLYKAGSTIYTLSEDKIGNFRFVFPNKKEQDIIVSYLDSKCGEVDKVISTQEKRIALLQELKQSIITHAVTKGLNPNVKMKDSGIEWIGEVPEHWVIMRVKDLLRLLTDYDANGSFADIAKNCNINNGNPYAWMVRATDLENNRIGIVDGNNYCDKKTYEYLSKSSLSENDILLAKRGDIGKSYLVPFCNDPMTLAPNTYLLLTDKKKVNNKCLFYYFQSYVGAEILRLLNKSTTLGALYKDDVKSINVPIAPLLEQQEIASYLDKRCAQIDASISKAKKEIELLQEYKQRLITEVVTGKRKVC